MTSCASPAPSSSPSSFPAPGTGASASASAEVDATAAASDTVESVLDRHGLAHLDARRMIEALDAMSVVDRPANLLASVHPAELVLTVPTWTDGSTTTTRSLPMPDDEFYLSVAPYRVQTHDCTFHSLTTCLGEMPGQDVEVTVTDGDTGQVILDETRTTYDNGFVGLWLPRDLDGTLTIRQGDAEATSPISTGEEDLTCLTTMRLV